MLIEKSEICFNLGHPTPLGYLVLVILVVISFVGWYVSKKK